MDNTTEKELIDALAYSGCAKLPRAINPVKDQSRIWIRAIAKVRKITGTNSYAILKNDYGRKPKIVKMFGESAAIASIDSIHPYEWLKSEIIPSFKTEDERDMFIAKAYNCAVEKVASRSKEEKDRLLYVYLMDAQTEYMKARKDF